MADVCQALVWEAALSYSHRPLAATLPVVVLPHSPDDQTEAVPSAPSWDLRPGLGRGLGHLGGHPTRLGAWQEPPISALRPVRRMYL